MSKIIAIWSAVAVLGGLLYIMPKVEKPDEGHCSAAWMTSAAQWAVEAKLRDPKSASFSEMRYSDGVVVGQVRAQNAFGGYVVNRFVAEVECVEGEAVVRGAILS